VAGQRFDSAPSECGRATDGGVRSGGNRPDGRRRLGREVEDDPGRWAKWAGSAEWAGLAAGLAKRFRAKNKDLNRWASDLIFELISRILSSNKIVLNIFKLNLNGVQTRINSNILLKIFQIWNFQKLI
jgi:hypothetical protein